MAFLLYTMADEKNIVPKNYKSLIGKRFKALTIIEFSHYANDYQTHWLCKCDCGVVKSMNLVNLKSDRVKSCGCLKTERIKKLMTTHNKSNHPLYTVWKGMKARCYNPKEKYYYNYGGRGVRVCDSWLNDFSAFYEWAINNGWQKGLELDKDINDTSGLLVYSPATCKFVTKLDNANKKRNNKIIEIDGVSKTVTEWALSLGVSRNMVNDRLKAGWDNKRAVFAPKTKEFKGNQFTTGINV